MNNPASLMALGIAATALCGLARAEAPSADPQGLQLFFDATGISGTLDLGGPVNTQGAFFKASGRTAARVPRATWRARPWD